MREPGFWWRKPGLAAWLLSPVASIYAAAANRRMQRPGFAADIPVICVGNFTLGGTGKTPTAIAISALLAAQGETPFFLTRGYGGTLAGPVQVDIGVHRATDVGDEPLLLARAAPTVVSRDRAAGAVFARNAGASIVVMDDGLQNPSLRKDISIAVVDARRGIGNSCVFPAGPLRASLSTQLARVGAILVVGQRNPDTPALDFLGLARVPILHARLEPSGDVAALTGGRKALAFAGIGDPEKFFATLASAGINAPVQERFADHHPYSETDAQAILTRCEAQQLIPVTTEKDLARLAGQDGLRGRLAASAIAVPVRLVPEDGGALLALLTTARRHHISS